MSKKTGKIKTERSNSFSRTDYLCVLPGILMCILLILILAMDLSMPEMAVLQYRSFPAMFRAVNYMIIAAGIGFYAILFARKGVNKPHKNAAALFIAGFLLCIILSTVVNGFTDKAVHGVSFRNIGIFHIAVFFLIYMVLSGSIRSRALKQGTVLLYIGTGDLIAAAVLWDRFVRPVSAFAEKKDISAIFFNGNHYGYFLVMAVLAAAGILLYASDIRIRIFAGCSMALNLLILLMNGSSGCLLAVCAGLLFAVPVTLLIRPDARKITVLLLCGLAVLAVISIFIPGKAGAISGMFSSLINDVSAVIHQSEDAAAAGHNRWLLWTETWKYIIERPLLGYGCEGLSDVLMDSLGRANPHNEVLAYAAQFGIPAAVFYTLSIIALLVRPFIKHMNAETKNGDSMDGSCCAGLLAAFGYFISSLFGVTMFYTLPFFFIFLGLSVPDDDDYFPHLAL